MFSLSFIPHTHTHTHTHTYTLTHTHSHTHTQKIIDTNAVQVEEDDRWQISAQFNLRGRRADYGVTNLVVAPAGVWSSLRRHSTIFLWDHFDHGRGSHPCLRSFDLLRTPTSLLALPHGVCAATRGEGNDGGDIVLLIGTQSSYLLHNSRQTKRILLLIESETNERLIASSDAILAREPPIAPSDAAQPLPQAWGLRFYDGVDLL